MEEEQEIAEAPLPEMMLKRSSDMSPGLEQPSKRSCILDKENLEPEESTTNGDHVEEEPREEYEREEREERQEWEERQEVKQEVEAEEDIANDDATFVPVMITEEEDAVEIVSTPDKPRPDMIVIDETEDDENVPGPDEIPTAEERGFWKAVEENPNDFASWTYLLQVVEKNGKLKQVQKAFVSFLQIYPYCYGYWKKYSDQMKKLVSNEAAFEIFNDAVKAIPLSVDLWTYFIHFIAEWKNGDEDEIRLIYQRAVDACGQDYKSDKIWEAYVEWEKQTDKYRVLILYKQFLSCVIQRHQYHFDKFREWIFFTPVKDMVTMDDIKLLLAKHKEEAEKRRIETERRLEVERHLRIEEEKNRIEAEEKQRRIDEEEEQRMKEEEEQRMKEEEEQRMKEASVVKDDEDTPMDGAPDAEKDEGSEPEEAKEEDMETDKMDSEEAKSPAAEETPVVEAKTPSPEAATPAPEAETPAPEAETPVLEAETPVLEAETPASEAETPVLEADAVVMEVQLEAEPVHQITEEFTKVDMEEPFPDTPEALTDRQEAAVREQILLDMAPVHELMLAELDDVTQFEEGIKRPYFHVKELERIQLKNWKSYLDVMIAKKDNTRSIILFERCLIACAFYEGFWIKYANFMEDIDQEETSNIYRRACLIHLVKKPQIHLTWAAFEEKLGNVDVAREALEHIETNLPGLIVVTLRRVSLERRHGNKEDGAALLKQALETCRGRETRDYWAMKYLTYTQYILQDLDLTKKELLEQLDKSSRNKKLYLRMLDLEMNSSTTPPDLEAIVQVLDTALDSSLSSEDKAGFSHRKMTFLEDFSDDIASITKAYEDHHNNYRKSLDDKKGSNMLNNSYNNNYNNRRNDFNSSSRNSSGRDRNYNSYRDRDSNYRRGRRDEQSPQQQQQQPQYNQNYSQHGYGMNTSSYGMQQQQQQQYQQWYSQYAQYAGQYPSGPTRGY